MNSQKTSVEEKFESLKRELFDRYYSGLNEPQRAAIYCVDGPLLVLAGAGSGKTTVLTKRIAHIIKFGNLYYQNPVGLTEKDVDCLAAVRNGTAGEISGVLKKYAVNPCPPWAIMSITFTNKAANEMKERIAREVGVLDNGEDGSSIWCGTFHSMCLRILRKFCAEAGIRPGFTVFDADDSKKTVARIMKDFNVSERTLHPKDVYTAICRAKERLVPPEEYTSFSDKVFSSKTIAAVYSEYQKRLDDSGVLDFDDIIFKTVRLMENNDEVKQYLNRRFKYICVDEYQDTNYAQLRLVRLLSEERGNLMVVGDDDQSIYRFRGACIENILNFDREIREAAVVKLEQNYRSTKNILGAANTVIANNKGRHSKTLFTDNSEGEKIKVRKFESPVLEARNIISTIKKTVEKENRKYRDFAILYRINALSGTLETEFSRSGIPYRVIGGLRFFERKEIKDIIAYLCLIGNFNDNLRLRRIINEPKRKIGETTVSAIEQIAGEYGISMFEVMSNADNFVALSRYSQKLKNFVSVIQELKKIEETGTLAELVESTIDLTGYRSMLLESTDDNNLDRLENLQELINIVISYCEENENAGLNDFLEEIALVSDIDNYDSDADAVVMMTIHSAKGLEFPVVFLPGMEEGIFPGIQSSLNIDDLEEERRLAYVSITRAKDKLLCSCVRERHLYGKTMYNDISRFLTEMDGRYLDKKSLECLEDERSTEDAFDFPRRDKVKKKNISQELLKQSDTYSLYKESKKEATLFEAGTEVVHPVFGPGTVVRATPMGADVLYEVDFLACGKKKLMGNYSKLKKA